MKPADQGKKKQKSSDVQTSKIKSVERFGEYGLLRNRVLIQLLLLILFLRLIIFLSLLWRQFSKSDCQFLRNWPHDIFFISYLIWWDYSRLSAFSSSVSINTSLNRGERELRFLSNLAKSPSKVCLKQFSHSLPHLQKVISRVGQIAFLRMIYNKYGYT